MNSFDKLRHIVLYIPKCSKCFAFYLLLFTVLPSCKKYLDAKQDYTLVIPSTLSDAQALLDYTAVMNQQTTPTGGEASSDAFFVQDSYYNRFTPILQSVYTWQPYPYEYGLEDWSLSYRPIYYANLALDLLPDIPRNASNAVSWDNVKGAALFYRSYYYLCLLWNYSKAYTEDSAKSDLGIVLRKNADFNIKSVRASSEDCYQQVITDTKTAIPLLPAVSALTTRPSKAACYGLLARCYLSIRRYEEAGRYADSALAIKNTLMDFNADGDIPNEIAANYPINQFNKETIFYTELDGMYSIYYNSSSRIDTILYASYDSMDLRREGFFRVNNDGYYQYKGAYTASAICFSGIAVDEIYLIIAEARVRTGNLEKGINVLNSLLVKRYKTGNFIPFQNLSQQKALDAILMERKKELLLRGLRWIDIKRLNRENRQIYLKRKINGITYQLPPNSPYYAFPIPIDIVREGVEQNVY